MNVLLADDDNAMRLYFTKFLEKRGFTVTPCSNGKDAWEEFQKSPFNLVLLDWNMPQMTGAELCERIKQNQKDSYTYVILITSRSDAEDIIQGLESGADDYITKPVVAAELNARITSALRVLDFEEKLKNKEKEEKVNTADKKFPAYSFRCMPGYFYPILYSERSLFDNAADLFKGDLLKAVLVCLGIL